MQSIKIIIADKDELYCECISKYILEKNKLINLTYITKYEFIIDSINKYEPDILIISKDLLSEEIEKVSKNILILILDNNDDYNGDFDKISKYQKTENFINEIILKYAEKTNNRNFFINKNDNTKLVMIYSPIGYCGKSTVSYALGRYVSSIGKRVLYLNVEKIGMRKFFLNYKNHDITMSDLFLVSKEESLISSKKNDRLFFEIRKAILKDDESEMYYILPPSSCLEFDEMKIDEIIDFLKKIQDTGMFDYIFIDMDTEFTIKNLQLMQIAWKIFVIFEPSYRGYIKYSKFVEEMNMRIQHNLIMKKITPIINCIFDNEYLENMKNDFENREVIIPYISKLKGYKEFKNSYKVINNYLKQLYDIINEEML